jgi:micrococcal nuclease
MLVCGLGCKKVIYAVLVLLPLLCFANDEKITATITDVSEKALISLDNGQKLELAGIIIPDEIQGKAYEFIKNAYVGQEVKLLFGKQEKNRYGNYLAQVQSYSDSWLQGELLERGFAFVYPTFDNYLMINQMLLAEKKARDSKAGIWAYSAIIPANDAVGKMPELHNKFAIIEGEVSLVKKTPNIIYINFGEDWKTDFTVGIRKENYKQFPGLDILSLKGKKIRVRGWVEEYNGPFIEVYNVRQVEL